MWDGQYCNPRNCSFQFISGVMYLCWTLFGCFLVENRKSVKARKFVIYRIFRSKKVIYFKKGVFVLQEYLLLNLIWYDSKAFYALCRLDTKNEYHQYWMYRASWEEKQSIFNDLQTCHESGPFHLTRNYMNKVILNPWFPDLLWKQNKHFYLEHLEISDSNVECTSNQWVSRFYSLNIFLAFTPGQHLKMSHFFIQIFKHYVNN